MSLVKAKRLQCNKMIYSTSTTRSCTFLTMSGTWSNFAAERSMTARSMAKY